MVIFMHCYNDRFRIARTTRNWKGQTGEKEISWISDWSDGLRNHQPIKRKYVIVESEKTKTGFQDKSSYYRKPSTEQEIDNLARIAFWKHASNYWIPIRQTTPLIQYIHHISAIYRLRKNYMYIPSLNCSQTYPMLILTKTL